MKSIEINVDFSKHIGKIKPMHAVNNTPTVPNDVYGLFEKMKDAGIPYARFHDTGGRYGGARYIDIANIFPDFNADEQNPESYDFAFTDVLLSELVKNDIKPFYRLGATIENQHRIKAYNIYPPKDNKKWAYICEMIIRHYNEGWNNGFLYNIEYWEIWNEPDNEPEIVDNPMWKGTKEQYFELYRTTYNHLKKCFPDLKIGGYSSCGFYALSDSDFSQLAHSSPRTDYFIEFFIDFLQYIKKNNLGLDFFSWHSYASIKDNIRYAQYARMKLDEYGYKKCEVFLNEWNTGIHNRGTLKDASDILSLMCGMQNTPTDMCMYYDAQINSSYCGIFDPLKHDIFKAYYAFYVFNKLYVLQNQNECSVYGDNCYALAASDNGKREIVIVNNFDEEISIKLSVNDLQFNTLLLYRVDETHEYDVTNENCDGFVIPAYGFVHVEF